MRLSVMAGAVALLTAGPALSDMKGDLAATTGYVDIVLLGDAGVNQDGATQLLSFLELVRAETTAPVRISAPMSFVPRIGVVRREIEEFTSAHNLSWDLCWNWFLDPDTDPSIEALSDMIGGSFVLVGNGVSTDFAVNPSADFDQAMAGDPVYASVFEGGSKVTDRSTYFTAVHEIWFQASGGWDVEETPEYLARLERAGWRDGC